MLNPRDQDSFLSNILEKLNTNPNQILHYEGYCKWFTHYFSTLYRAKIFGGVYAACNFESICDYSITDLEEGSSSIMRIFSTHLKVMFMSLMHDDQTEFENVHIKCRTVLQDFQSLFEEGSKQQDHFKGSEFLLDSLVLFANIVNTSKIDEKAANSLSTKAAELLKNPNAKAVITAGRRWFLGDFVQGPDKHRLEVEIIDQILELDPDHWEWNLMKYKMTRWQRRGSDLKAKPENDELKYLTKAYQLNPTNSVCLISVCQFLAEFLKGTEQNRHRFPFEFGELTFGDCQEIVDFLKQNAIEYKENFPNRSNAMNEFGKIFSSDLPWIYRDRKLAKACLEIAISRTTKHSKFLHRMGIFYIQDGNFRNAQPFLEEAVRVTPTNDVALIDLMRVYMTNIQDNSERIRDQLPQLALLTGPPSEETKFLVGYLHAKLGEEEQAVKSWMNWAQTVVDMKIERVPDLFKKLAFGVKFLGWPNDPTLRIIQEQGWIKEIVQRHPQGNVTMHEKLMELIDSSITIQPGGRGPGRSTPNPRPDRRGRNYRSTQPQFTGSDELNWRQ